MVMDLLEELPDAGMFSGFSFTLAETKQEVSYFFLGELPNQCLELKTC